MPPLHDVETRDRLAEPFACDALLEVGREESVFFGNEYVNRHVGPSLEFARCRKCHFGLDGVVLTEALRKFRRHVVEKVRTEIEFGAVSAALRSSDASRGGPNVFPPSS